MKRNQGSRLTPVLLTVSLIIGSGSAVAGIGGSSLAASSMGVGGYDLLAFGPVDSSSTGKLQVLGQSIGLSQRTLITSNGARVPLSSAAALLASADGAVVAVYGTLQSNGAIVVSQIDFSSQAWVPGSTT